MEELISEHGLLPDTVEAKSGGGGRHILFQYPGSINAFKSSIKPGIDIKADGGYIVAAPSLHDSGNLYEWELSSHPLRVALAKAPEWLLNLIRKEDENGFKKPVSFWLNLLQGVEHGQRNIAATQLSGYMLRRYFDPHATLELIYMWNERNKPPLDKKELHAVVNSVAGKELARRKRRGERGG